MKPQSLPGHIGRSFPVYLHTCRSLGLAFGLGEGRNDSLVDPTRTRSFAQFVIPLLPPCHTPRVLRTPRDIIIAPEGGVWGESKLLEATSACVYAAMWSAVLCAYFIVAAPLFASTPAWWRDPRPNQRSAQRDSYPSGRICHGSGMTRRCGSAAWRLS